MLDRVAEADAKRDYALVCQTAAEDQHGTGCSYLSSAQYKRYLAPWWYTWQQVYSDADNALWLFGSALDHANDALHNFIVAKNNYNSIKSDAAAYYP
jgi:hypothetical protein